MSALFSVTVDTEEEWNWNAGWPSGRPAVSNIALLPRFQEICARHGAAVTYFTNQAVLDDDGSRDIILDLASDDAVEIGLHIHPWNTPPAHNGSQISARESFLHNLPKDVAWAKLDSVYSRFLEHGLQPTSFRGGRYSSGGVIHEFLVRKGFVADASVVPFTTWEDDGAPDYRYRNLLPARLEPVPELEHPLWEIPLTMGFTRQPFALWSKLYHMVASTPLRHLRLIGIAERLNLVRRVWLSFEDPMGRDMLDWLARLREMRLPCICFTLHSSSLMAGANGCYSVSESDCERLFRQVDEVLGILATWTDFQPATVSQIARSLEGAYHARSRN